MTLKSLSQIRFEALAGYTRVPSIVLVIEELDWLATEDERLLGIVTWDRIDHDFGWLILARDERLRYRAVDVNCSLASTDQARGELKNKMAALADKPDEEFHQGDVGGGPVDFFKPVVPADRLNPKFGILVNEARYSPARELIAAMMRYYDDIDGNFIEQFQTTAFDARLWELYLFATFTELGYARQPDIPVPDFLLSGPPGVFGVEATTVNPPASGEVPHPTTQEELGPYIENLIPIKLGRALRRKLNRRSPYWQLEHMRGVPFVLAIQDFHAFGAMQMIVSAATEYVFGVRHSLVEGGRRIEWITDHRYGALVEPSGFFKLPGAENISAVILNPQGTLAKFNRMGFLAGFGDRRVQMVRTGVRRGELDEDGPMPKLFVHKVHAPGYQESWVEGMVVLHNPNARFAFDPPLLPGAAHEFLQPDGSILSMLPDFHPLFSETRIAVASNSER